MTDQGTELFEAIRRDYQAGDRLPSSLATRHGVPRQTVLRALSDLPPLPLRIPTDEEQLDSCRRRLDELLEEDQAMAPEERRSVFELYQDLDHHDARLPVSYRWVWEYVTRHRCQHPDEGSPLPGQANAPTLPRPGGPGARTPESADRRAAAPAAPQRAWADNVRPDMPGFVTDLITGAVRQLAELRIEATLPAQAGVELGLVSLATAAARINQALYEIALVGRGSGLSYAQMSAWTGIHEDALARQVEDYHRLMTT